MSISGGVICPYYVSGADKPEKRSLRCEDMVRQFKSQEDMIKHIKVYCCDRWQECKFAVDLNRLYDEVESLETESAKKIAKLNYKNQRQEEEIKRLRKQKTAMFTKLKKNKKEKELMQRNEKAALYIAGAKEREITALETKLRRISLQQDGLINFIGYLCYRYGVSGFSIREVTDYANKWDTRYRIEADPLNPESNHPEKITVERIERKQRKKTNKGNEEKHEEES